jgi:hypothetical protein
MIAMEQHTLKNVYNCLKTSIYPYLETFGGQSSNLYQGECNNKGEPNVVNGANYLDDVTEICA